MNEYPVDRYLRAGRAAADLSQRELAKRAGVAPHVVVAAESDPRRAHMHDFVCLLRSLGLALQVVDADGRVFEPEPEQAANLRDRGRCRFPAHLDGDHPTKGGGVTAGRCSSERSRRTRSIEAVTFAIGAATSSSDKRKMARTSR